MSSVYETDLALATYARRNDVTLSHLASRLNQSSLWKAGREDTLAGYDRQGVLTEEEVGLLCGMFADVCAVAAMLERGDPAWLDIGARLIEHGRPIWERHPGSRRPPPTWRFSRE